MSVLSTRANCDRIKKLPGDASPKTRGELMWWLWHNGPKINFNIFKEGAEYAVVQDTPKGPKIFATHQQRLSSTTFDYWKSNLERAYW